MLSISYEKDLLTKKWWCIILYPKMIAKWISIKMVELYSDKVNMNKGNARQIKNDFYYKFTYP